MKIAITGTSGSGKDTLAEYLVQKKGFEKISLSGLIRDEAKNRRIESTRENLRKLGNEMRQTQGNDILAKIALEKIESDKNYIITSVRHPQEIKILFDSGSFVLLSVDAPVEVRFERVSRRGDAKEKNIKNLQDFQKSEAQEMDSDDFCGQKVRQCMNMAKFTILNNGDKNDFFKKFDDLFDELKKESKYVRPSWDRYFMDLVQSIGQRGTCNRGRAGCLIARDKRIIATGYAGAPERLDHCDEIGHLYKDTIHEDGSVTRHCIRTVHAEANAVAQAAKYGIAVDGATIYCKIEPCLDCAKLLISAGIKKVVCETRYHAAKEARQMLADARVEIVALNDQVESYGNK